MEFKYIKMETYIPETHLKATMSVSSGHVKRAEARYAFIRELVVCAVNRILFWVE